MLKRDFSRAKHDGFKIHAIICTYNDHVSLPFALDSVKDSVDSIIVADGAYKKYYENYSQFNASAKPWSTDGTLEMLKILQKDLPPITLIETPNGEPWLNQVVKRNALIDAVPDKDWFIVLDSDEMLYGAVKEGVQEVMDSGCIQGSVPLYNIGLSMSALRMFWHPRIFLKLPGMHYARKHWYIYDFADRMLESEYPLWHTNFFVLAHLKVLRDFRRLSLHERYMLQMSEYGWMEPTFDDDFKKGGEPSSYFR
jgi:hypothetical protein